MSKLADLERTIHAELVEVWHHLHQNPELSFQEFKTADYIEKLLRESTGVDRIKRVGKTGLWAELKGTAPKQGEGPVIALRGDMDALPIQEESGVPFQSLVPGVMHACGHDVHTASLLGAVRVLERCRDKIPGSVWFFFQPAEEIAQGARLFLTDPEIDFSKLRAIAGIHVYGYLEAGKVMLKEGAFMAAGAGISFTITGRGGHSSSPHKTRDPVTAAGALIMELQTVISRELNPTDTGVLSLCMLQGGTKINIIPNEVSLAGTLRSLSRETQAFLIDAIRRVCKGLSMSMGVSIEMKLDEMQPALINDAGCVKIAEAALNRNIGRENVVFADTANMGGEDFAFYLEKVPGVFMFIGSKSKDAGEVGWHTDTFYTDEEALRTGVIALSGFALEFFGIE
jgi:amidohydrolase